MTQMLNMYRYGKKYSCKVKKVYDLLQQLKSRRHLILFVAYLLHPCIHYSLYPNICATLLKYFSDSKCLKLVFGLLKLIV